MKCFPVQPYMLLLFSAVFYSCSSGTNSEEGDGRLSSDIIFESSQYEASEKTGPVMAFEDTWHDFGALQAGQKKDHLFSFVNEGDAPLLIANVHSGCGCTVSDYSQHPVHPGEEGFVVVTYNSTNRHPGRFSQKVSIISNSRPPVKTLNVTGKIIENPEKTPF